MDMSISGFPFHQNSVQQSDMTDFFLSVKKNVFHIISGDCQYRKNKRDKKKRVGTLVEAVTIQSKHPHTEDKQ
jgi:cytochrome c-type biogenesis protein CcmE